VVRARPQARHAGQPQAAAGLTALGTSRALGVVVKGKLATGGLKDASPVRLSGVRVTATVRQALNHGC
jgi:hypothetical protein